MLGVSLCPELRPTIVAPCTAHYGEQDTQGWGEDTTGITTMNKCPEWVPKA
jgi:hypothetical protein